MNEGGAIANCFAQGDLISNDFAGGLVGSNYSGSITNCYAMCSVSSSVAGIAEIGGLVGYGSGLVSNCYFLETYGPDNGHGTVLSEELMKEQSSFSEWDFVKEWGIGENQTFPYLRKYSASDINKDEVVNLIDLSILAEDWMRYN